jgi:outer membrane autotransporter protein
LPPPPIDPDVPLIRPEIPGYTLAPSIVSRMGLVALDTFHQRRGDQSVLDSYGAHPAVWGRLFGQSYDRDWDAAVDGMDYALAPSFDGHIFGIQAGLDLFGKEHNDGTQDRVALFFTHTRAKGDVSGNVLAMQDVETGEVNLNGTSLGVNWTHIGAAGWYVDAIAMGTVIGGVITSDRGIGADMDGNSLLLSLEGGYPFALGDSWKLEPQAQIVWQRVDLDDTDDGFSGIDYEPYDGFIGRLGVRLEGNTTLGGKPVQPFATVNLWQEFSGDNTIVFNEESVTVATGGTTLELQGGLTAQWTEKVSLYGSVGYMTSVGDEDFDGFTGNLGLRAKW